MLILFSLYNRIFHKNKSLIWNTRFKAHLLFNALYWISDTCNISIVVIVIYVLTYTPCTWCGLFLLSNLYQPDISNFGLFSADASRVPEVIPGFSGGFVTRSLVLCVCFVFRCLSFCPFSLGHYVVCPFSMYGFWLPHLYLQTHLQIYCGSFFHFSFFFSKQK